MARKLVGSLIYHQGLLLYRHQQRLFFCSGIIGKALDETEADRLVHEEIVDVVTQIEDHFIKVQLFELCCHAELVDAEIVFIHG